VPPPALTPVSRISSPSHRPRARALHGLGGRSAPMRSDPRNVHEGRVSGGNDCRTARADGSRDRGRRDRWPAERWDLRCPPRRRDNFHAHTRCRRAVGIFPARNYWYRGAFILSRAGRFTTAESPASGPPLPAFPREPVPGRRSSTARLPAPSTPSLPWLSRDACAHRDVGPGLEAAVRMIGEAAM